MASVVRKRKLNNKNMLQMYFLYKKEKTNEFHNCYTQSCDKDKELINYKRRNILN